MGFGRTRRTARTAASSGGGSSSGGGTWVSSGGIDRDRRLVASPPGLVRYDNRQATPFVPANFKSRAAYERAMANEAWLIVEPTGNESPDQQLHGAFGAPSISAPAARPSERERERASFDPKSTEPVGRSKGAPEGLPLTNIDGSPLGFQMDYFGNLYTLAFQPEGWQKVGDGTVADATVIAAETLVMQIVDSLHISLACIVAQANEIQVALTSGGTTIFSCSVGPRAINDSQTVSLPAINARGLPGQSILIDFTGALSVGNFLRYTVSGHSR